MTIKLRELTNFERPLVQRNNEISFVILFSSAAIAVSALLIYVPNIEAISISVFLAGYLFRFKTGLVLFLSIFFGWEIVVSVLFSPSLALFIFKFLAWSLIFLLGYTSALLKINKSLEFLVIGIFSAILWDAVLLFALPIAISPSLAGYFSVLATYFIVGLPFTFLHIIGNAYFFSFIPFMLKRLKPQLLLFYPELLNLRLTTDKK